MRAYQRRRGWAAWFSGAPANFRKLTLDQLSGEVRQPPAMSADQLLATARRIAVAHNVALAARANDNRKANDGE